MKNKKSTVGSDMPILEHLNELRFRILISLSAFILCFIVALFFYDKIITLLLKPFLEISSSIEGESLYINTVFEGFIVRLKLSVIAGVILSSPIHLFNVIRFIFPALQRKEKKIITVALICSFAFVVFSFFYSYYNILPISISFLTGKGFIPENTGILLNFNGNISYVLQFVLVALVIFQIPIILEILLILNVLTRKALLKYGRYVIILFFIMSAILTPPDFVTQVGLALPLTLLYFLTIMVAKIFKFGESEE